MRYYTSDTNGPRILLTPGILLLYIIPGFPSPIRSSPIRHRRLHVYRWRLLSRLTKESHLYKYNNKYKLVAPALAQALLSAFRPFSLNSAI